VDRKAPRGRLISTSGEAVAAGLEPYEEMLARLEELHSSPPPPGDPNSARHYQEMGRLEKVLRPYREYRKAVREREEAEELASDRSQDGELRELAREETKVLAAREEELKKALLIQLVADEGADRPSAIVEIRAGTGGDEAALFAGDLCRMYRRYVEDKRWKLENLDASPSDHGGFKGVIFRVEGEGAFGRLRFEAGTHRVQRVPKTEAQGRIHTSAATVAVLPEAEEIEIEIPESDLDVSFILGSGPGGQSVNTTSSAVRIVHKPTGINVKCMVHKSQRQNRAAALAILRAKLLDAEKARAEEERTQNRRSQIGTGDRSGRIRTYNFPQNRVTDHRLEGSRNFPLERVIEGDLDAVIDRLIEQAAGVDRA
jgi:peptide chain release factor 1